MAVPLAATNMLARSFARVEAVLTDMVNDVRTSLQDVSAQWFSGKLSKSAPRLL